MTSIPVEHWEAHKEIDRIEQGANAIHLVLVLECVVLELQNKVYNHHNYYSSD